MNPPCPHCDSKVVVKNGHKATGEQKYICRSCYKQWHEGSRLKIPRGRQCYYCGKTMAKYGSSRGVQYYTCCGIRQNDDTLDRQEVKFYWKT